MVQNTKIARLEAETNVKKEGTLFKDFPDKSRVQTMLGAYEELQEKRHDVRKVIEDERKSRERKAKAQQSLRIASERLEKATQALDEARQNHAVLSLAHGLKVGDVCPVCQTVIEKSPKHEKGVHLADLKKQRAEADDRKEEAHNNYSKATSAHSLDTGGLKQIQGAIDKLETRLKKEIPQVALQKQLRTIEAAEERLSNAREKADTARQDEQDALDDLNKANKRIDGAWGEFNRLRDKIAKYDPPPTIGKDLSTSWKLLLDWRDKQQQASTRNGEVLASELNKAEGRVKEKERAIVKICREEGIEAKEASSAKDVIIDALARAEERLKAIDAAMRERKGVEKRLVEKKQEFAIAGALARHLRADSFERWILHEAFERLREGGSRKLEELSSGDYSFHLDDQLNFDVIDHRNADEVRPVRTLSGGETFLASLALALTLAEQLAEMATEGAAKLESIFLDEGFGALDSEALDLVATTLEDLGARGRVVGIVTHVKELAERIPLQYRVTKDQNSSSVERIAV